MWIPNGSELQIPWQHPAQMATCYRINIQTAVNNVSLIRAKALFAESTFNMSIDLNGYLNVKLFDGFFYSKNLTDKKMIISDDKTKDIEFCANRQNFNLSVNEESLFSIDGNFTFFINFNQWKFIDKGKIFVKCSWRILKLHFIIIRHL